MTVLMLSEPSDYKFLVFRFVYPSVYGMLQTVTPSIATEILTCEKQSLTVSVFPLRYAVWPLEIIWLQLNQLELLWCKYVYCSADRG
jgi:hypothetical protein